MILSAWLDLPIWLMASSLIGFFVFVSGVIAALSNIPATRRHLHENTVGTVPTFFSSIGLLLALLTGFVANDAWDRHRQGARVVQSERASLIAVYDISIAANSDMAEIRRTLLSYTNAILDDEWPMMANGTSSAIAGEALSKLMQLASNPNITVESGTVAHTALLNQVLALRASRSERLALNSSEGNDSKWITLLALAALTMTAIGIVHVERPRAQAVTLTLFSLAMLVTLAVIVLHEQPFDGPLAIGPDAYQRAKSVMLSVKPDTSE
ncbi:DUF4239 domain-containing protein [Methylobacterium sp. E-045]|uniref:bestrophin-like domain n=1 Tax=Methylobacterium sp. E-045 TaxID=2836575 RepID=UPI001FB86F16|nr:DUF4239 domain-containing protein [Methylobacterium sp. E-045]MCJ2132463.1 DUF4239 domain-containing protein [Methylobacterium sp. E-045]